MNKFKTYIRTSAALTRKDWLKQRRATKDNSSTIVVSRVAGSNESSSIEGVAIGSGAGEQALNLLNELFERVNIGTDEAPEYAIRAKYGLYSDGFISAGGLNRAE